MYGKNVRIEDMSTVIPSSVFSFIGHAYDAAMMASHKIVTNDRCEYCFIIMRRAEYDSVDKGIRKRVVKAFEEGDDWSVIAKFSGVTYRTE